MSVDLLPSDSDKGPHYQGNIFDVIGPRGLRFYGRFDLAILHPPCTYLANSSARWLYDYTTVINPDGSTTRVRTKNAERWRGLTEGAEFFRQMLDVDVPRVAVENPVMLGHAKQLIGVEQTQIIQPWMFGEGETKATGLWLRNLPELVPTDVVTGRVQAVHLMSPGPDRWKKRSTTYQGIANAMASQWGSIDASLAVST